ncbi:MAG: HAD family hydrolase [Candidatus Woesearchaeota archaeon]
MIKTIIFDFDGVIVDTENKKFTDLKILLKQQDYVLKKEYFSDMIGKKTDVFILEKFPNIKKNILKKIISERRKEQNKNIDKYKLIKGIKKLLNYLKSKNIKIGLTTGSKKQFVLKILEKNKLESFFDVYVTGEDFKSSKPNPECFKLTLKKLNASPKKTIIVEDSNAGIQAAKKTNAFVFGVNTYKNLNSKIINNLFDNHLDILKYLEKNKR